MFGATLKSKLRSNRADALRFCQSAASTCVGGLVTGVNRSILRHVYSDQADPVCSAHFGGDDRKNSVCLQVVKLGSTRCVHYMNRIIVPAPLYHIQLIGKGVVSNAA